MKVLLTNPTGNQNSKNLGLAFLQSKKLEKYITVFHINANKIYFNFLPKIVKNELKKRDFSIFGTKVISSNPIREIIRILVTKLKINKLIPYNFNPTETFKCLDKFSAKYINSKITHVYNFQNCALQTFLKAKQEKIKCVYELPTVYWKEHNNIIKNEIKKKPEFKEALLKTNFYVNVTKQKLLDKELSLADLIIVPSQYVKKTLKLYNGKFLKIKVIPYGFPKTCPINKKNWYDGKRKLKILYAGSLNQNKGISYLVKTINKLDLDKIEIEIIGSGPLEGYLKKNIKSANFLGSISNEQILRRMKNNDIFISPTLFEGFGLTLSEAMSQGLVVMTTKNTFLGDLKKKNIFIKIDIKNIDKIVCNINRLIKKPSELKKIGQTAIKYAKSNSWKKYRKRIIKEIN